MARIDDELVQSMAMGKVFKDNTARINSLDFYKTGEHLVTASDDESIHVYNAVSGNELLSLTRRRRTTRTVLSKKYGVDLIRWTHNENTVICASKNSWDETLRYLSLHDNHYLRYFKGHRDRVTSLAMSPVDDTFLSASLDSTVRLWDLRTNACQGLIRRTGRASVAYDAQGLIFAVATSNNAVKLYDLRSFEKGPFATFFVDHHTALQWSGIKFSNDGKYILLPTTDSPIFLIDAFTGKKKQMYTGRSPSSTWHVARWKRHVGYIHLLLVLSQVAKMATCTYGTR
ncbi:WD domain, G-beta repeat-containing protein [Acanthamoeba castellanii str. Neff]|uniref:WD domain, G-beta repeat-containing protein n=1 Tax=Acanthamoeba castellanii (strain ATCC 30010 / Neff) TaxID=1257118 RepID=L8GGE0_ACACF|nr:WD domain, G-beta repeat-containing protein [Acanthamoeba castellanii str. Neff]ELR12047.1 WD domain, G-beta repeat-containing protein [Acanthamoeba castellanii str. Neff]